MHGVSPLTSPLHDRHVAAGAKLADFGGWSMPIEYAGGGVLAEHTAVREGVGLFDVSHLGTGTVRGPGAAAFVKVGDTVAKGQTLLIVEAMKTMNHIPAPASGTVKRILIDDGVPVEFGSPLMIVE